MHINNDHINYIAFHATQIHDNSLYHGRLGIILALCGHGMLNTDKRICNFVRNLIQASTDGYYDGRIGIENGLAGYGLAFTLLYKVGMLNENLNEVLFDIDKKIMSYDLKRMDDFSFREGLSGVWYYVKMRMSSGQYCWSLDRDYVNELGNITLSYANRGELNETLITSIQKPSWGLADYMGNEVEIDNGLSYFVIQNSYEEIFSGKK